MGNKKIILAASYSVIEPLGLFHLSSIAKQEGWKPKIILTKEPNFLELDEAVREFRPSMLGFTVYTGNHLAIKKYLNKIKSQNNGLEIIVGGPHPTVFPEKCNYADYIVISEGFNSLRKILRGEIKGLVHLTEQERFPLADREDFYRENPFHQTNSIGNIITQTGCPYKCAYCYNSLKLEDISHVLGGNQLKDMGKILGKSRRLFPKSQRPVQDIIDEVENIQRISPETKMIFFQDDAFGSDIEWLREFTAKYNAKLPFHIMTRFNYIDPTKNKGKKRVELLKKAGCSGLTLAIESSNQIIRKEILNRKMEDNDLMFRSLNYVNEFGFTVRTFSMLGLPLGATTIPTKINIEADIETLEFNVKLKKETGLPTVAWASILVPYPKTAIDYYCQKHGFYKRDHNDIVKESYRKGSVLNFAKEWVGQNLSQKMDNVWLSKKEQERYKNKLDHLMKYFPLFAGLNKGHKLAREYLEKEDLSPEGLNNAVRYHLYDYELFKTKK